MIEAGAVFLFGVFAVAGWRLGAARLCVLLAALMVGGGAAIALGFPLHSFVASRWGGNSLLGLLATLVLISAGVGLLIWKGFHFGRARRPGRWARVAGAALGAAVAGSYAWAILGPLPSSASFERVAWVTAPFVHVRAMRVLASLSPEEGEWVVSLPEVRAVAESDGLRRLMDDDARHGSRFERAADGDWIALFELAADPSVKEVLDSPELLELVRRIDLPAIAAEAVRRRERLPDSPAAPAGSRSLAAGLGHSLGRLVAGSLGGFRDLPAPAR